MKSTAPSLQVVAQTPLSTKNIIMHWSAQRAHSARFEWGHQVKKALELVEADMSSLEESSPAKAFLLSTKSQLIMAPFLLSWAKSLFDIRQKTPHWCNQLKLAAHEGLGLDSLEDSSLLRDYKSQEKKTKSFRAAVPPSTCDLEQVMLSHKMESVY